MCNRKCLRCKHGPSITLLLAVCALSQAHEPLASREPSDPTAHPLPLLRKKIEAKLHALFPEQWIPLYSMVTFNEGMRYSEARDIGSKQARIMDDVMQTPGIHESWEALDFTEIVSRL